MVAHSQSPQLPGLSIASLYRCLRLQGSAQALSASNRHGGWGRARSPSTAAARTAFALLVPAERGVRGFPHAAESPHVADAVIEAQRNARSFCATENSQPVRSYCETGLHCTPESGRRSPRASLRSPAGRVSRRAEDTLTRAEAPHYALGLLAPWEYA